MLSKQFKASVLTPVLRWSLYLAVLGVGGLLWAPSSAVAQHAVLAEAKQAYETARYDESLRLFEEVAAGTAVDREARTEALRHVGELRAAKGEVQEARRAVEGLLALEPPIIELDPCVNSPAFMKLYFKVRGEQEGDWTVNTSGPEIRTLAIMDFSNNSITDHERYEPLTGGFPSMVINALRGATELKVLEREHLQTILEEIELQKEGEIVDQSTAVEIGEIIGVHAMLFGDYIVHQDVIRIDARLVRVETSEILLAEQIKGDKDEFFTLIDELSAKTAQALDVELGQQEPETESFDAMQLYAQGIQLIDQEQYKAAYNKLMQAAEQDPNYTCAQQKAQHIKPMLALQSGENAGSDQR